MNSIKTEEISKLLKIFLKYLERAGFSDIFFSLDDSYHKKVWQKDKDLPGKVPWSLAYIEEDIEFLKSILYDKDGMPNYLDLGRIGKVLALFGNVCESYKYEKVTPFTSITIKEFSSAAKKALSMIKRSGYEVINFPPENSYYLWVKYSDRQLYEVEPKLTKGYVSEDLEALQRLIHDKKAVPTPRDFERFGEVLTVISERLIYK